MTNTARILEEVVSLEAWHPPLSLHVDSPFHVALSFSQGRFQGGTDNKISFKVSLKRATLVVLVDEKLKVPNASKIREYPPRQVEVSRSNTEGASQSNTKGAKAAVDTNVGLTNASVKAGAEVNKTQAQSSSMSGEHREVEQVTRRMRMTHHKVGAQETWKIEPIDEPTLRGLCHDGKQPIMEVSPKTDQRLLDVAVRVLIKCDADDIEITDIKIDKSIVDKLMPDTLVRRKKQAKVVIAAKLAELSLELVELDRKFEEVILADVLAVPE